MDRNGLLNGLMAYRQRRQQGGGFHRPGPMGGGYDSSGINPGGGMPRQAPQASPMHPMGGQMQPMPMSHNPMASPMSPPPMQPQGGGYDSSGINPQAGHPMRPGGFQVTGVSKPAMSQMPAMPFNRPQSI